jgi:hypothetical protein
MVDTAERVIEANGRSSEARLHRAMVKFGRSLTRASGLMESHGMNATEISGAGGIDANLSPDAFHRWPTHYYKCRHDFASPHKFSPVP